MSLSSSTLAPKTPNRRRRVRHKIQTPAYASFADDSASAMLDLHEIVDISEDGLAIQCHSPLETQKKLNLWLDLADCSEHIHTTGLVIWSNESGRSGLRFEDLSIESLARLREWLFINVMAGVANGETDLSPLAGIQAPPPRPGYTDTLAAVSAVHRQVQSLGSNLDAALQLVAERAQTFLRASGAAIAVAEDDPDFMVCKASSGQDAPPVGARLQVGTGFSGECVQRGILLLCDDTENDDRVDQETCRALGIRSILAVPIRRNDKSVALLETFATKPNVFTDGDGRALQRLAETVLAAMNNSQRNTDKAPPSSTSNFTPAGSVLFASAESKDVRTEAEPEKSDSAQKASEGITLPKSHLIILGCAAATIALVLGIIAAPAIQSDLMPWIRGKMHEKAGPQLSTVLASTQPPRSDTASVETATIDQLRQMAERGDGSAGNALGLRYATGDGVTLDEKEAIRWFTKAAEQGNVPAQSKLGSIYFSGRGVPQDSTRAYFWMAVARLSGDEASKTLAPFVRARLTRAQVTSIELEADHWLQQHRSPNEKPAPGQLKAKN